MVKYPGVPEREAWHNWFTDKESANKIAHLLNMGTIKYIHRCSKDRGEGCAVCQAITNANVQKHKQELVCA